MYCELGEKPGEVVVEERLEVEVPDHKKKGSCASLFDFIAISLQNFVTKFHSSVDTQVRWGCSNQAILFSNLEMNELVR